jgi:hypothetical protein
LLYPPDGVKWVARTGLSGTTAATAPNGRSVSIFEVRGWLRNVETSCNFDNSFDWRYDLEPDPEWLDWLGLPLETFLLAGDVLRWRDDEKSAAQAEIVASSGRARYSEASLHIELDGWPRTAFGSTRDARAGGNPVVPATWALTNDCHFGDPNSTPVLWPYDPRNPSPGDPPLMEGQYVRVVGSLATDEPHMMEGQLQTSWLLRVGYGQAKLLFGKEAADKAWRNAIKWLWAPNVPDSSPTHPARWNEIHSPDFVKVLESSREPAETVRCMAVVAQNGLFSGDTEELTAEIQPPARSRWYSSTMVVRELIGSATNASTVSINEVKNLTDRVRVHAQVKGQGGMGASGKFHAIYRVSWQPVAPALTGTVEPSGALLLAGVDGDSKTVMRTGTAIAPFTSAWSELQNGRAAPGGWLTAVSRAPKCFDAFVVGTDGNVYTAATQGTGWGGWWQIAGTTIPQGARVDAVSRDVNKLDIFCADTDGHIVSAAWKPAFTKWAGWWWIRNGMTAPGGAVTAVSRRTDYLDIFIVGTDGGVYTAAWDPGPLGWQGWWRIGNLTAPVGSPVSCVSRSVDKLDLLVADSQGRVMEASWAPGPGGWQGWNQILGGFTKAGAPVAAVRRRPDYLDIFVVGTDGRIYTAAAEPAAGWQGWWVLPGIRTTPGTRITAFVPAQDVLVVMTSTSVGRVVANRWEPATAWQGWSAIG